MMKKEEIIYKKGIETDKDDYNNKTSFKNGLTPRKLQIIALITFIGNLSLILALGFKVVQFYSIIIGFFSIAQIFISHYYYKTPESDKDYYPPVTIIVPAYNEENTIAGTLKSCVKSGYPFDKLEVITVNDGSTDLGNDGKSRTLTSMYETQNQILKETGFKIRVLDLGKNFGKREAMIRGFLAASKESEIFVTVDADSYVQEGALQKIIQPFQNKDVGAVSGNTEIANSDKLLTKLQNYMYWTSYNVFKASESFFGTVMCCPGCFSAFRKTDLMKVLPDFRNESFCTVSEDRNLTNLILAQGREIVYKNDAMAKTNAPERLAHFIKQQYRWKISTIYENIFIVTPFINKKHPFIILNFYVSFILIFSWSIAGIYAIATQIIGGATMWAVFFWLTCMPVFPLYWAWKEKKIQNFGYGFFSIYIWMFLVDLLNYFAFANLRTKKWGGKEDPNSEESTFRNSIKKTLTIPFRILFKTIKSGVMPILPKGKRASIIQSFIVTASILIIIGVAYYINLRIPVASFNAYMLSFLYYVSQMFYIGLSKFVSEYWVGLIGMIIFGVAGSKIIQRISCKNKNKSIHDIVEELYPEFDKKKREKIIKEAVPVLSEYVLHQNDKIASPLFLLLNLPFIGKYISVLMKNSIGNLIIKPIVWIIEILTMLILYRFFLRHFILPLSMSSKYLSRMIGEKDLKIIITETKGKMEEKNQKKGKYVKTKCFITLQSFLNFFDHKILKWSTKKGKGSILWNIPLGCAILIRAFTSLVRQRVIIAFIARYIATPIAALLISQQLLDTTIVELPVPLAGIFPVTVSLVITSFIIIFFLELPRMKSTWDKNKKKYNRKKAFFKWIISSCAFLSAGTLSMILVGPELIFAMQLTSGIPLLGETVRFMEEFVYGANGQGGIGEKIFTEIENRTGIINNPIKDGWDKPAGWNIERNGYGVMPEPLYSMSINGPGEASSNLFRVDNTQNYVVQFMADSRTKNGAIDVAIEEFNLNGNRATLIKRVYIGGVDEENSIGYIVNKYKPSSPQVNSARVVITAVDKGNGIKGYIDGVRVSRVTNSAATKELNKPHIILRFDDGWKSQALPELKTDDYGYPAVYNIIPDALWDKAADSPNKHLTMDLNQVFQLSDENQIGTHSGGYVGDNIDVASNGNILLETLYQYRMFNALGFKSDTYASPNFVYNEKSLQIIFRTFNSHQIDINNHLNAYKFPFNRYRLFAIEPVQVEKEVKGNNNPSLMNIEETKRFIDSAILENATPVLVFHMFNKAGDPPKNKLEMETTTYNDLLDYIHAKGIQVITFDQLFALQEESLSDQSINSFDGNGIKGEEGTYYPIGSVQLVNGEVLLQDYMAYENIEPIKIPYISKHPLLNEKIQAYGKSMISPPSSVTMSIVPIAAVASMFALLKRKYSKGIESERNTVKK